ncbi:MAG: zinc metalloprotease HtpX [Deltaproteobacteria bacterium]|nr:zinc metalloprotease HtpX [Deltaproteobacteria bacterium]
MNGVKTIALLVVLSALLVGLGSMIGGPRGATMALVIVGVMNLVSYWFSDKIVLRMYKAKEVTESESPDLYHIVADLAQRASIPMPRLYIIPSETPNAFATGRNPNHAAVACTTGILRILDRRELTGVLGHELSHVFNRDILIGTIAATIAGAISWIGTMFRWGAIFGGSSENRGGNVIFTLLVSVVVSVAAMIVQLAVSRTREFAADEAGAKLTGDPSALASALQKLEAGSDAVPMQDPSPATAHMFIVNPLRGGGISKLFSTHPPTADRVERLMRLTGGGL